MARRADISVLLFFNRQAYRADFVKPFSTQAGAQPQLLINEAIDAEAALSDSVKALVDGQPRLASRTLVLSTDVWSQIISLPRISITGIETDELEAALRFEAETLSGIEIDDLSLAYRPVGTVGDFDQFWVNVLRQTDLESVIAFLEQQGCREITLAHPAGFANSGVERIDGLIAEVWDDLSYLMTRNGVQLSKVKQASSDPAAGCAELLLASSRVVDPENQPEFTVILDDDNAISDWTSKVAARYADRLESQVAPVLRKSKPRSDTPIRHFLAATLAALVVVFCYWHWTFLNAQNADLASRIVEIKKPAIEKKDYDSKIVLILQEKAEVESENVVLEQELNRVKFFLTNQNDRIAKLLSLLIELRKPDLVIQKITGTEDGLEISGFSINGESAQALAKRLRIEVQSLGWLVKPAKQEGQEKLTTGGPWTFRILLTDIGPNAPRDTDRAVENRILR